MLNLHSNKTNGSSHAQWWCERLNGFHSGLIDVKSAKKKSTD